MKSKQSPEVGCPADSSLPASEEGGPFLQMHPGVSTGQRGGSKVEPLIAEKNRPFRRFRALGHLTDDVLKSTGDHLELKPQVEELSELRRPPLPSSLSERMRIREWKKGPLRRSPVSGDASLRSVTVDLTDDGSSRKSIMVNDAVLQEEHLFYVASEAEEDDHHRRERKGKRERER